MTTTDLLIPGHLPLCAGCVHRTPDASHPSPCCRVRWEGQRHVGPALNDSWGRVECDSYVATEPVPATWTPKAPEPTRGVAYRNRAEAAEGEPHAPLPSLDVTPNTFFRGNDHG